MKLCILIFCLSFSCLSKVKSFKGWELYVLQKAGKINFSLLEGSKRLKDINEIKENSISLNKVLKKIDNLEAGQFVSLSNRFANMSDDIPTSESKLISNLCQKKNLNCYLGLK
jgi:hypothetical protein